MILPLHSSYVSLIPNYTENISLPANSHLTLAYTSESDWNVIVEIIEQILPQIKSKFAPSKVNGFARFTTANLDALVVLIEPCPVISHFRTKLVQDMWNRNILAQRIHSWIPHITMDYVSRDAEVAAPSLSGIVDFNILRFKEKQTGKIKEWKIK